MKIKFYWNGVGVGTEEPIPASKSIPDWYKKQKPYTSGEKKPGKDNITTSTIKKCMPVLDAITTGYIIKSPTDLYISQENSEGIFYQWSSHDFLSFHSSEQISTYPNYKEQFGEQGVPKFNNYWVIETPKGYSCLFITPLHRDLPFTIIPGIVDTDSYTNSVNFPFILNDKNFEGLIPKGTPIAQVIPFKRDSWDMEAFSTIKEPSILERINRVRTTLFSSYFDKYKNNFWFPKEYR